MFAIYQPPWPGGWWGFGVFAVLNFVRIYKPWTWKIVNNRKKSK